MTLSKNSTISLDYHVEGVVVYPDSARVTARGRTSVSAGRKQLIFDNLPLSLREDSVRARGRGSAQVQILGVDVSRGYYEKAPSETVQELEKLIEAAKDERDRIVDDQKGLAIEASFLDGLQKASEQYAKGLARGKSTIDDWARVLKFLNENGEANRTLFRRSEEKFRQINARLEKLLNELNEHSAAQPKSRYVATMDIDVAGEGDFEADIDYLVRHAGWKPIYDIRLSNDSEHHTTVTIDALADISQETGQDWRNADLLVSTARPALSGKIPKLEPWFIDEGRPVSRLPLQAAPRSKALAKPAAAPEELAVQSFEATQATASVKENATTVTFHLSGRVDIPGDGSPHKSTVAHARYDVTLDYIAVPKRATVAYRRAKIINSGEFPLLSGEASIFVDDQYIGQSEIDYTPVGGELELHLGVEERIEIEYDLESREVDRLRIGDRRRLRYGYVCRVKNLLPGNADIEIHDQLPLSRHEQLIVNLISAKPEPQEISELNLLHWQLNLGPLEQARIEFQYRIEHPRQLLVSGLTD